MFRHLSSKRLIVSPGYLLAVLFLASAPWSDGQTAAAQSRKAATMKKAASKSHIVVIKDMKYQPAILTVKVGSTVEWKNADIVAHTVTAADNSFDSRIIAPGGSWKLVARKAGKFDYICTLHPNMSAKLIVQ
jgi:plastocyanin